MKVFSLKTDPRLIALLKKAAQHKMTPAEKREQRISFIHGQTGCGKELISKILDEH